jgi:flagellar protein FliL
MADDDATAVTPAKGKAKKGKGNLVPAIIVAVALVGAAYLLKGGATKKAAATTRNAAVTTSTTDPLTAPTSTKSLAQIAKLDDVTLNLADGHFLKLGLALQLTGKGVVTDYTTGGAAARALDLAISVYGRDTYAQLVQPAVREEVKAELNKQVVAAYNGHVLGIYITDFVMQ